MTTLILSDLRRDEALQRALMEAHWNKPVKPSALGLIEVVKASIPDLSAPRIERTKL